VPAVALILLQFSVHHIDEGHIGVYYRGGALLSGISEAGYRLKAPFIDRHEMVQVTIQTDKVTDIPCGTSGGVMIYISKVEVVNRLRKHLAWETIKNYTTFYDKTWIYDKIHSELNAFCSSHTLQEVYIDLFQTVDDRLVTALQNDCDRYAPGIEVIAIRITKPKIPDHIMRNYEAMEAEKTKLLISTQTQKVVEKEAETERKKATIEAEKNAAVSKIRMEQEVTERESKKRMSMIEDEMYLSRQKALTDAEFYKNLKVAEANQKMLSEEFLRLEMIRSVSNNTKIYFGPSINAMYLEWVGQLTSSAAAVAKSVNTPIRA